MTLARHLLWMMAARILLALAVLVALLQLLALLEVTPDILHRGQGLKGVATYIGLSAPHMIAQAAPLAVLAGSLFGFGKLARENAVVALRGAGLSAYRLLLSASPATVGVFIATLALSLVGAPRADQGLVDWWRTSVPPRARDARGSRTFRVGADIVTASPGDEAGRRLEAVTIYRRDASGRLSQRISAASADYGGAGWRLEDVSLDAFAPTGATRRRAVQAASWTDRLHPLDVRVLFEKEPAVSWGSGRRALAGGAATRAPDFYRMRLQRMWAGPVAVLVMLLLAVPAALATFRNGRGAGLFAGCLGSGLLFMVADGVAVSMGLSGALPVLVAAWAAPVAFAIAGATALLYLEG